MAPPLFAFAPADADFVATDPCYNCGSQFAVENARATSEEIFDRNLVMLSLGVSRDVAYSGGDTLSETTSNLFQETTGRSVFLSYSWT